MNEEDKPSTGEHKKILKALSQAQRRNAKVFSGMWNGNSKYGKLFSRPALIDKASEEDIRSALDALLDARAHFYPSISEQILRTWQDADFLNKLGGRHTAQRRFEKALKEALKHEEYELVLYLSKNHSLFASYREEATHHLAAIRQMEDALSYIRDNMRLQDLAKRKFALLPLLDNILSSPPTHGGFGALRIYYAARLRILFFLRRFPEALKEAQSLIEIINGSISQSDLVIALFEAMRLKILLGMYSEVQSDLAHLWRFQASDTNVHEIKVVKFLHIGWLTSADIWDSDAGIRTMQIFKREWKDGVGASVSNADKSRMLRLAMRWALFDLQPADFDRLLKAFYNDIISSPKEFEWPLIMTIAYYFVSNEQSKRQRFVRLLSKIDQNITSQLLLGILHSYDRDRLKFLTIEKLKNFFRDRLKEQPELDREFLDLSDLLELKLLGTSIYPQKSLRGSEKFAGL